MNKKLKCIMLVDDNEHDNFFHEREIKKFNLEINVIMMKSGLEALQFLKSDKNQKDQRPDLIFLDINMPGMNGWEFMDEYDKLDQSIKSSVMVIMLTTSDNPEDNLRAKAWNFVTDYITKPLTNEKVKEIVNNFFYEQYY